MTIPNANTNSNTPAATEEPVIDANAAASATGDDAAGDAAAAASAAATNPPANTAAPVLTQADIDRAVKKAQKDWEKKIKDAEAQAQLSADQVKDQKIADLERKIRLDSAQTDVTAALEKAGAKNPALLFSVKKGELEFDASGKLTNLTDILDDLKTEYADQFGVEKPNETINAGAGQQGKTGILTKAQIDAMSTDELIKNMEAVDAFLASQK